MRSTIYLKMVVFKLGSQNKSNKQSMHVELCKTKLLESPAIDQNSIKIFMHDSMHWFQLWALSQEFDFWWPWLEELISSDLLDSCNWIQETLSTRETASIVLKEAIVFSDECNNMLCRLIARTLATSGLQAHCSRESSKTEHSGCKKGRENYVRKIYLKRTTQI